MRKKNSNVGVGKSEKENLCTVQQLKDCLIYLEIFSTVVKLTLLCHAVCCLHAIEENSCNKLFVFEDTICSSNVKANFEQTARFRLINSI